MRIFWNTSKSARHRTRSTLFNFLLAVSISAGVLFILALFMALYDQITPRTNPLWDPRIHSWWINSKYGQSLGMRYIPVPEYALPTESDLETYHLTISDRPQWTEPDYAMKYRSLLSQTRRGYHLRRRSHIQELGTRVTCWPNGHGDGGFYSRRVSAVELDWLGLPRFQDTLPSQDFVTENVFREKFKDLLPFYYRNSTWYPEIVKWDEKQLRGCEPGFRRTFEGGFLTGVEMRDCYMTSPLAVIQRGTDGAALTYLDRPFWGIDKWGDLDEEPGLKWKPAGIIGNALTMEERTMAIRDSGGKTLTGEKLKNSLECWYGELGNDCSRPRSLIGYEDVHYRKKRRH